jgi:hypothetical protein
LWRGKNFDDPLGPGWGMFVANTPYLDYVSQFASQEEVCVLLKLGLKPVSYHIAQILHCVGFSAMLSANTKHSKGLRATGIGAVSCAQHEMYRPNGMGDLQVGERYVS